MKKEKLHLYLTWALQIILGLLFLAAGAGKFLAAGIWIRKFADWGYPNHFHLLVGSAELLGAILLFIPRSSKNAAMLLMVIMIGAVITHVIHREFADLLRPVIFMVFLSALIFLQRGK